MLIADHGILFIHIPKSGGTSISWCLREGFGRGEKRKHTKHFRVADWVNNYVDCRRLYKFAFIRNPWDRMVSWFAYRNRWLDFLIRRDFEQYKERFRKWILQVDSRSKRYTNQIQYVMFDKEIAVDFIGDFHHIERDWSFVASVLSAKGANIERVLPTKNKSRRLLDYRPYYDEETAERVRCLHSKDVVFFEFEFENMESPVFIDGGLSFKPKCSFKPRPRIRRRRILPGGDMVKPRTRRSRIPLDGDMVKPRTRRSRIPLDGDMVNPRIRRSRIPLDGDMVNPRIRRSRVPLDGDMVDRGEKRKQHEERLKREAEAEAKRRRRT